MALRIRSPYQFSLATLLIAMTIIALVVALRSLWWVAVLIAGYAAVSATLALPAYFLVTILADKRACTPRFVQWFVFWESLVIMVLVLGGFALNFLQVARD
jgi:hypothetical protein